MNKTALPTADSMYEAVLHRDASFDGIFFTAVRTTGIFCRPTCPARKPARHNVEFFASSREALFAGYRPCKRCRPMESSGSAPAWLRPLLSELEVRNLLNVVQDALQSHDDAPAIEVISAVPTWVELLVPCSREAVEQIHQVVTRLGADLPDDVLESVSFAFRELVMNAVEWGGQLDPSRKVRITCVRTDRMLMYRIADPGQGFSFEGLDHAAGYLRRRLGKELTIRVVPSLSFEIDETFDREAKVDSLLRELSSPPQSDDGARDDERPVRGETRDGDDG